MIGLIGATLEVDPISDTAVGDNPHLGAGQFLDDSGRGQAQTLAANKIGELDFIYIAVAADCDRHNLIIRLVNESFGGFPNRDVQEFCQRLDAEASVVEDGVGGSSKGEF